MIPDYKAIVAELNAKRGSLDMFNDVLADYHQREYGTLRGEILPYLMVIMTRLNHLNLRSFTFEWYRSHIELPTHVAGEGDNWDLIYKFSEDHIGMVHIRNGCFDAYGRFCCTENPELFWSIHVKWDNQIEWTRWDVTSP